MKVAALAGGIGAGKFLRGLARVVAPEDVTVVVNTADDLHPHGLHVSPDLDSVVYWLADTMDRERGWGRGADSFRTTEELRAFGAADAWFGLGDLDLATNIFRTAREHDGATLSQVTRQIAERFALAPTLLPMSDDPVTTRIDALDAVTGTELDLHFQEFWVQRGAVDTVRRVRFEGAERARPAPGVLEAIEGADTVVICPSNPIASIFPILAVPGIRERLATRADRVVGISPIVGGAPVRGMADTLMPAMGYEVTAAEAARCYQGLLAAWVIDDRDEALASKVESQGLRVATTDTMMIDDAASERIARIALDLLP